MSRNTKTWHFVTVNYEMAEAKLFGLIARFMGPVQTLPPQRLPTPAPPLSAWREAVEVPSTPLRLDGLEAGDEDTIAACIEDAYPLPDVTLTEDDDASN